MKELKELIKLLSAQQKELKKARKTGPYIVERTKYGYPILPENVMVANNAAGQVQCNRSRVTAALNLYHELRGSSYRHNFSPKDYEYHKAYKELSAKYKIPAGDGTPSRYGEGCSNQL